MSDIKRAFDQVKASEELKEQTESAVVSKMMFKHKRHRFSRMVTACICLVLVLGIGGWTYLTPTMAITIDTNPAIELGVNRFDRVVSISSDDDKIEEITKGLKIRNKKCQIAIDEILRCPIIEELEDSGQNVSFGVDCDKAQQRERVQECINECQKRFGQKQGQDNDKTQSSEHHGNGQGNGYHGGRTE